MADQHHNVSTFQKEGISRFPTHLLHQENMRSQRQHGHRHRLKSPASTEPLPHSKCSSKPQQRSIYPKNWAGGPGMQAIFLDSKQKSCGTGVFLPQRTGTDFQFTNYKPAFSSVLLPARVVEALNLNVHELCSHIKPPRDVKKESNNENDVVGNKERQSCVISQKPSSNSCPDIFLPKEWTY